MTTPNGPADQNQNPAGNGNNQDEDSKPIPRSKYRELLEEKKKAAERARLAEERLAKIDADKKAAEDAEALKRGEHEKVIKAKEEELAAERKKNADLNSYLTDQKKLGSFLRSVGGHIDSKWYDWIQLEKIAVDKDGKIDEASLTKYVEEYKKTYPETIGKLGAGGPGVPDVKPKGGGGKLTHKEWLMLSLKEKRERLHEVE